MGNENPQPRFRVDNVTSNPISNFSKEQVEAASSKSLSMPSRETGRGTIIDKLESKGDAMNINYVKRRNVYGESTIRKIIWKPKLGRVLQSSKPLQQILSPQFARLEPNDQKFDVKTSDFWKRTETSLKAPRKAKMRESWKKRVVTIDNSLEYCGDLEWYVATVKQHQRNSENIGPVNASFKNGFVQTEVDSALPLSILSWPHLQRSEKCIKNQCNEFDRGKNSKNCFLIDSIEFEFARTLWDIL